MLRIGLIGAGWHALADHAPALRHCASLPEFTDQIELTAVCDLDIAKANRAAHQFNFRCAYDSIEAMLPEVDVAVCLVSPAAQRESLQLILNHRKPVLIEKPLGRDLTEAESLQRMLHEYPHMISLNRRFDPAVTIARQWMQSQPPARTISGVMLRINRTEADFIWSTGVHLCDLIWFLSGPAKIRTIDIRPAAGRVEERVDMAGDDWSVQIHTGTQGPWRVRCIRSGQVEIDRTCDPATPSFERNGTVAETSAFLHALLNDQPLPSPTVADAMPGTRLASSLSMQDE